MIIYNVTVNIDNSVADEWLLWMKEIHIPQVMDTGLFITYRIMRLIGDEDSGGITYAIQYSCASMNQYEKYLAHHAPALQADHTNKYKDRFVAFRTLLEIVE
jgi:hypothetical protein